jgi:Domain of unknown function (DUF4440)
MHQWFRRLGPVCLAALIPTYAPLWAKDRSQALEREVKTTEQRWLDNEDSPAVVQSILADDFVHVLPGDFISKDEHLDYLRQHPGAFPGTKHFEDLKVRIYGQIAIATGIVSNIRESNGRPVRFSFTDVFVRRAGKWLAVNAQELPLEPVSRPEP